MILKFFLKDKRKMETLLQSIGIYSQYVGRVIDIKIDAMLI